MIEKEKLDGVLIETTTHPTTAMSTRLGGPSYIHPRLRFDLRRCDRHRVCRLGEHPPLAEPIAVVRLQDGTDEPRWTAAAGRRDLAVSRAGNPVVGSRAGCEHWRCLARVARGGRTWRAARRHRRARTILRAARAPVATTTANRAGGHHQYSRQD